LLDNFDDVLSAIGEHFDAWLVQEVENEVGLIFDQRYRDSFQLVVRKLISLNEFSARIIKSHWFLVTTRNNVVRSQNQFSLLCEKEESGVNSDRS